MSDPKSADEEIYNILRHFKDNQNRILLNALNDVPTCTGTHLARLKKARRKHWWRRVAWCCRIFALLFIIFVIFWFLRSINSARILGGCPADYFWPFEECQVVF